MNPTYGKHLSTPEEGKPPNGYRPSQIAKSLGLSKSLVYEAIKQGDLQAVRIRTAILVLEADLQKWLEKRKA